MSAKQSQISISFNLPMRFKRYIDAHLAYLGFSCYNTICHRSFKILEGIRLKLFWLEGWFLEYILEIYSDVESFSNNFSIC